jgi:DoxX-like protein
MQISGLVLSVLGAFPLVVSGILYILKNPVMLKNVEHVGYSSNVMTPFGIIKIIIAALTLIPATSFVGVILATGWMGGAIAAHVRVGDKYVIQVIIPILIWVGLGFRHQNEIRALLGL